VFISCGHGNKSSGSIKDRAASKKGYIFFLFNIIRSVRCDCNQPIQQEMHTIYMKSQIFQRHELFYIFQQ
jgi:hypothetical protein